MSPSLKDRLEIEAIRHRLAYRNFKKEANLATGVTGKKSSRKKYIPLANEDLAALLAIVDRYLNK